MHPITNEACLPVDTQRVVVVGSAKFAEKKCNENDPTCDGCARLRIECQYGSKPSWMDGGTLQEHKAATLKADIKQNATHKRERAQNHMAAASDAINQRFGLLSDITVATGSLSKHLMTPPGPDDRLSVRGVITTLGEVSSLIDTLPWSYRQHQCSDTLEHASATEWNFIMKYIDFVSPAMFPLYKPHIFDTGQTWLLLLLRKNRISYHAALGLSCYYFTIALSDAETGNEHAACKQK